MDGYLDCSYHDYLFNMVDSPYVENHTVLLDILCRTDFRWSVPNDDNRALDGTEIRYNYQEEFSIPYAEIEELLLLPCSVIEVICGLAIRMDEIMRDPVEPHINRWFWELIGNLGLLEFSDQSYKKGAWSPLDVKKILDIFMDRTYDELGRGGLFPRICCDKNQKEVELFSQMNGYINEHYC